MASTTRGSWSLRNFVAALVAGALIAAVPAVPALLTVPAAAQEVGPRDEEVVFRLQDPTLTESSGLAVSRRHNGTIWTHNDGGSAAQVLALDRRGRTKAVVTLRGIDPFDPEALATGSTGAGAPALFLGDIGDNRRARNRISVFRFQEPARLVDQQVRATWFRLTYPDGPHDAEALLVDPRDNRIWIATKDLLRGGLYRAPARLSTQRENALERVAEVPGLITDGAFLSGGRFVLRSYATVYLYRSPGRLEAERPLPAQEQGESLAVDDNRLLVGSEGRNSPVYAVPIPTAAPTPAPTATPSSSGSPPESAESERAKGSTDLGADVVSDRAAAVGIVALILVGVSILGIWRRRRRGR